MDNPGSAGPTPSAEQSARPPIERIVETARAVITDPTAFFKSMPKSGGFAEPLVFVVAMGFVAAIAGIVLAVFGLGIAATFAAALVSVLLVPIFVAAFSFIGAAILFAIWRLLGSQESYETAYRCSAYMMAITPITTLLEGIPYLGSLAALGWALVLVVIASEQVHKIEAQRAWIAFGIVFALMAMGSITTQMAARRYGDQVDAWSEKMEGVDEMSPEEAGRAVGDFLKGLQESVQPDPQE